MPSTPCKSCQMAYVSNVSHAGRDAIQARRVWINKMLFWSNNFNIYHTTVCQWYVPVGFHSHSWLYIPGLLFRVIQYKLVVFSYQTKPARVLINNFEQTAFRLTSLSSFCGFFEPITNLTICQSCQRTPGLSSLTLGFKILVYLDEYSSVMAQTLNMFCMWKPAAVVLSANQCARMFENDVTCW